MSTCLTCMGSQVRVLYCPPYKNPETALFHLIGTQCVIGVQSVRAKARRKLMHLSLRLAFYIRMELNRSYVDCRSFQAQTDKMLCFQWLCGFQREYQPFLNFPKAIENTGKIRFFDFADGSSQTVVRLCFWSGRYRLRGS